MFVFLHIPKAAGTTFREIISNEINPSNRLSIEDISRIAYASDEWLNSHDFISGHFGVSLLRRLQPECNVLTMLRDPIARTRSQFQYFNNLAEQGGQFNSYVSFLRNRSLKELLSDTNDVLINSLFRNTQTWALVTDYQHHYRNHLIPNHEVLDIAKENLEKMNFFGLVEAMEDSLLGLNAIYGWNINTQAAASVKNNPTRWHNDDHELSDFISEHNQLDIELYQWAEAKFSERLSNILKSPDTTRPVIAETVDWRTLQFPKYDIEQFCNANGKLGVNLLIERLQRAESMVKNQNAINQELRRWAENAELRLAIEQSKTHQAESRVFVKKQCNCLAVRRLDNYKKIISRFFSRLITSFRQ